MSINERIKELGIVIPQAAKPIANYVGARKVGKEISITDAAKAAELCAINILSQLSAILSSDLDSIESCNKLGIFVNAIPEFEDHSIVANGASDLIVKILGDSGIHARAAVGVASLPKNVCVEVEAIFVVK